MATYSDIKTQMVSMIANHDDLNSLELLRTNFNTAQNIIGKYYDWEELETLKTGSLTIAKSSYSLSTDIVLTRMWKFLSFRINDGTNWRPPMTYLHPRVWDRKIAPLTITSNKPSFWTKFGGIIYIDKNPDAGYSYEIKYKQKPTQVVADTTELQLEEPIEAIKSLCVSYTWFALGEREIASNWARTVELQMKELLGDERSPWDFTPSSEALESITPPNYWADPFVKRDP